MSLELCGGGLSNSILALALAKAVGPTELKVNLYEQGPLLGGNHTWCFHRDSLTPWQWELIKPAVVRSWPQHMVRFPKFERVMDQEYCAITSEALHKLVIEQTQSLPHFKIHMGKKINDIGLLKAASPGSVVLDGRGLSGDQVSRPGFQKFVGIEVEFENPHGLEMPVMMDATIPQTDGFTFMYLLPYDQTRMLAELTFYSMSPEFNETEIIQTISEYLNSRSLGGLFKILRQEKGVLPIPIYFRRVPTEEGVLPTGLRANLFHPATGFSIVENLKMAQWVFESYKYFFENGQFSSEKFHDAVSSYYLAHERRSRYYYLLNKITFVGAIPRLAFRVYQRFYTFSDKLILDFYSMDLQWWEKVRLLSGKPPMLPSKTMAKNIWNAAVGGPTKPKGDREKYLS